MDPGELRRRALAEAEEINRIGREEGSGSFDPDRMWIHPEEWARMRSPLVVIASIVLGDGVVTEAENAILSAWCTRWLDRSYWGGYYRGPKEQAIQRLMDGLKPRAIEMVAAARHCAISLSRMQQKALLDTIDELQAEADPGVHGSIAFIRALVAGQPR